ncbi:NADPH oxidase organizer 1-like [Spea bombifrons]|uniref:NADPH oxidase organizer 1-like n=1 Tax=Spea bombifrons TaxID=233779 RepID=UPI00234A3867|nr:NADPH oxidase organizer 1-like [Spea bombifrons]
MDRLRYPVEATAVGLVQHGRQKIYMFSIFLSDRNNVIIYRTYEDFKELAKELKRKFPLESGLVNKSEQIIPALRDVPLLFWSKTTNRFMERLRLLEIYCRELLQTDSKISQCEELIQFFSPKKEDLSPSFPENSLVIMPSENDTNCKRKEVTGGPQPHGQPITQPVLAQKYVCVDSFETKDTKNRPFKVKKDECVDVWIKDTSGWWLVENEEQYLAWFPAPYLRKPGDAHKERSTTKPFTNGMAYFAVKAFEAQNTDELSLPLGAVVEVLEQSEIGWWLIYYNGKFGYVPAMFLKPYNNPHQKLQVKFREDMFGSTPTLSKLESTKNLSKELRSEPKGIIWSSEEENGRQHLARRKSRSLDGLANTLEESWSWRTDETSRRINITLGHQIRKDSGFDEDPSPRCPISPIPSPDCVFKVAQPTIPTRPSSQEIHSRCTTITRNAALRPDL